MLCLFTRHDSIKCQTTLNKEKNRIASLTGFIDLSAGGYFPQIDVSNSAIH